MTNQEIFIYENVLSGCTSQGVPEQASIDQANSAVIMYKRNQFNGKPLDLIKSQIQ